jgi:hypothetical protein
MPKVLYRPPQLCGQVFRGSVAIDDGLLTRNQLRTPAWRRLFRDVYADWRLEPTHAVRCHGAMLLAPAEAVISGPSAAVLHGVEYAADGRDPIGLTVPTTISYGPVQGLTVHTVDLRSDEIMSMGPLPATTPQRTAWDVATRLDLVTAVGILDGLLAIGALDDLEPIADAHEDERRWRRALEAFAFTDGRAQSRPESTMRVKLIQADFPRPEPQLPVPVRGGLVLHPDLAWEHYRVALEYDGEYHAGAEQLEHDRSRLNLLVSQGWIVLYATRRHLGGDFPELCRQVEAALRSRGWRRTP